VLHICAPQLHSVGAVDWPPKIGEVLSRPEDAWYEWGKIEDWVLGGFTCGITVELAINNRHAPVAISWHYPDKDSAPRLVAAYPTL